MYVLKCEQEDSLTLAIMFASFVLDPLSNRVLDYDGVWQEELLLVEVGYLGLGPALLILEEPLFVEAIVDGLDVLFYRDNYGAF